MKSLHVTGMLLLVSCGGQTLEVGNDGTGGDGAKANSKADMATELGANRICNGPVVDARDANWPDPVACAAAAAGVQSSIVGVWEGYSEDEYFVPTGGKFHIEILAASPGGSICGTVRRGDGPVPELSDDPSVMYPPLGSSFYDESYRPSPIGPSGLLDGANYSIISGGMADNEVRFQVSGYEHLKGWCALQTAYRIAGATDTYKCAPQGEGGFRWNSATNTCSTTINGVEWVLGPGKCAYCTGVPFGCVCDSCHCTANIGTMIPFDLTFNGDQALGPWGVTRVLGLRLKRVLP